MFLFVFILCYSIWFLFVVLFICVFWCSYFVLCSCLFSFLFMLLFIFSYICVCHVVCLCCFFISVLSSLFLYLVFLLVLYYTIAVYFGMYVYHLYTYAGSVAGWTPGKHRSRFDPRIRRPRGSLDFTPLCRVQDPLETQPTGMSFPHEKCDQRGQTHFSPPELLMLTTFWAQFWQPVGLHTHTKIEASSLLVTHLFICWNACVFGALVFRPRIGPGNGGCPLFALSGFPCGFWTVCLKKITGLAKAWPLFGCSPLVFKQNQLGAGFSGWVRFSCPSPCRNLSRIKKKH